MSDEEKNLPNTPDEPTGVVHWNGPKKGKWPEVLKAPEEPTGVIPSGSGKFRSISGDGGTPAGRRRRRIKQIRFRLGRRLCPSRLPPKRNAITGRSGSAGTAGSGAWGG